MKNNANKIMKNNEKQGLKNFTLKVIMFYYFSKKNEKKLIT
jgi:hypothetical protein